MASFEITDIPLIEYVALKGKPVIISTGIATLSDIEEAVNAIRSKGNNKIILLNFALIIQNKNRPLNPIYLFLI